MAAAGTTTLVDTSMLEELDFEPPCTGLPYTADCDLAAEWEAVFTCGHSRLWCDDHKTRAMIIIANMEGMICLECMKGDGKLSHEAEVQILYMEHMNRG
jgi:hypothetical protein